MSELTPIPVMGIVGGIGSGKSAVARWVAARERALLINGDEVGHAVLAIPAVIEQIRRRFGSRVIDATGQVDRRTLGQIVFGNGAEQLAARSDLEAIVHPCIRESFEKSIRQAAAEGHSAVLLDAAVLFEAGWNDLCTAVAFIDTPREQRIRRIQSDRGWSAEELARREASQWPLEKKQAHSQFTIDNSGPLERAGQTLQDLLKGMTGQKKTL